MKAIIEITNETLNAALRAVGGTKMQRDDAEELNCFLDNILDDRWKAGTEPNPHVLQMFIEVDRIAQQHLECYMKEKEWE